MMTMRKNLFTLALIGLCSFGFVACGDDSSDDDNKDNVCDGNDANCDNNQNGDNNQGSVDEDVCDSFKAYCEVDEASGEKTGRAVKSCTFIAAEYDDDGNVSSPARVDYGYETCEHGCNQGVCNADGDVECSLDSDCEALDASKPYCVAKVCVAERPNDPCASIDCGDDVCDRGICVSDAMKNATEQNSCNDNFVPYCVDDNLYECIYDRIVITGCAASGMGKCTSVESNGKYEAFCSGNDKAIALCEANEAKPEADRQSMIDVCYGTDWAAKVICVTDYYGKMAAYPDEMSLDCEMNEEAPVCGYDASDVPVCKAAE